MSRRKSVTVKYHNAMGRGSYVLTEPVGKNYHPDFHPQLTPPQMLRLGVFEGRYLNSCTDEYPTSWFRRARLSDEGRDDECNYYGVRCGMPLSAWRKRGWIKPDDPRGWFEWCARYFHGRRIPVDADGFDYDLWQIRRWSSCVARHRGQLISALRADRSAEHDPMSFPRRRQALLQWACDSRLIGLSD